MNAVGSVQCPRVSTVKLCQWMRLTCPFLSARKMQNPILIAWSAGFGWCVRIYADMNGGFIQYVLFDVSVVQISWLFEGLICFMTEQQWDRWLFFVTFKCNACSKGWQWWCTCCYPREIYSDGSKHFDLLIIKSTECFAFFRWLRDWLDLDTTVWNRL